MEWWRDLWDGWARWFGYDEWVWGSAADWFAAVGTVGALLATLYVVVSGQVQRNREQVDQLVAYISGSGKTDSSGSTYSLNLHVANYSSLAFQRIVLIGPDINTREEDPEESPEAMYFESIAPNDDEAFAHIDDGGPVFSGLLPGENRSVTFRQDRMPHVNDFYLYVVDGKGRPWLRRAASGQYVGNRASKKILQHASDNSG